jgi:hypothetical protein
MVYRWGAVDTRGSIGGSGARLPGVQGVSPPISAKNRRLFNDIAHGASRKRLILFELLKEN